jgi:transmembrane sensor
MNRTTFLNLLDKSIDGKATDSEQNLLEEYYKRLDASSNMELSDQEETELHRVMLYHIQTGIGNTVKVAVLTPKWTFRLWYAAASIMLMVSIGGYYYFNNTKPEVKIARSAVQSTIAPGSNKAVLKLSNGKEIVLTGATNGVLASQGQTKVIKKSTGELMYDAPEPAITSQLKITYNTITIPRGGQFQVVLPDGSKVFLNAASSLTYPTAFTGSSRNVELTGEAYFEVAKNKAMPFIVKSNGINVQVLGTHFDISAYQDDQMISTTLLEGSVRLNKGTATALLIPGQQGIITKESDAFIVQQANIEQVMAWTNGYFVFKDYNIKEVMKIVSRWYDIDVEYQGNVQAKKFGGTTSRYKDIRELLNYMKITGGINYKIEGRRVILMN